MPKQPFISIPSGDKFAPVWSGFADASLRPSLEVIRDGSGYRAVTASDYAAATVSGTISVDAVGVTGANGLAVNVANVSGFNAFPVFIVSGQSVGGTSSNSVTQVGITGVTGLGVDVVFASGFRAIPIVIASGNITSTAANPVTQVGITGVTGLGTDVALVSGFRAIPVFVVSGQGAGGGSSSSPSIVGLSGSGVIVSVVSTPNLTGLSVVAQGIANSGSSGNMPYPILGGAWVNPITSGILPVNSLQAVQLDTEGNLFVSLGTSLSATVDSVSVKQTGIWQNGITGSGGLAVNVSLVSGFNAIPVFVVSGQGAGGGGTSPSIVGLSGSGVIVSVVSGPTLTGISTFSQGISQSGSSGIMPYPVLAGAWVNPSTSGTVSVNSLQAQQADTEGNLFVTLGTALSDLVDSLATRPKIPNQNNVYSINLTGVGGFGNYSGVVPTLTGNVVVMSIQPHSSNNQSVYYSFSGSATTGNAWEIRGDRTIETSSNLNVFFAQATGNQIVNIHVQTF